MKTFTLLFILALVASVASAQWVQTNGPYGVNIRCFAVSGINLFAGAEREGVFLSTNSGASWTAVNTGLTSTMVTALAVSGGNLFAATQGGMFLSTNNGTSWTPATTPFSGFSQMVQTGPNLFAGTSKGVFLSTNNGTSWTAASAGWPTNVSIQAFVVSGTNLFVGGHDVVSLSTNNGASWKAVNAGLTNTSVHAPESGW